MKKTRILIVDDELGILKYLRANLEAEGYEVLIDTALFSGLERVRAELPGLDVIFVASDVRDPPLAAGLAQLRGSHRDLVLEKTITDLDDPVSRRANVGKVIRHRVERNQVELRPKRSDDPDQAIDIVVAVVDAVQQHVLESERLVGRARELPARVEQASTSASSSMESTIL